MTLRGTRKAGVVAIVAAGLFLLIGFLDQGLPAGAQASEQDQIEVNDREIRDLLAQIDAAEHSRSVYAGQLSETQARMDVLRAELNAAQAEIDRIASDIALQEEVIAETGRTIEILSTELAATQLEKRDTRSTVQDRAVDMYISGVYGLGGAVFAVDGSADFQVGFEYAENLLVDTEALLRSLELLEIQEIRQAELLAEEQALQEEVLAALDRDRLEVEEDQAALDVLHVEVDAELDKQQDLIAAINLDIAAWDNEMVALAADSAALKAEIDARQSTGGTNPGVLSWPVNGRLTSPFGNRVHPITGVVKLHTGMDIAAPTGTPVRAAGAGTVILARWFGGYGNAVVIDHGGGLTTFYAHQNGLNVSAGQTVSTGDVVGWVGSTGFSTGAHLHFETRENGNPVNPANYLNG